LSLWLLRHARDSHPSPLLRHYYQPLFTQLPRIAILRSSSNLRKEQREQAEEELEERKQIRQEEREERKQIRQEEQEERKREREKARGQQESS
jgi:hypothetical protein